jgi:acetyltransferase-like isoleucine patch superfamily enzyme
MRRLLKRLMLLVAIAAVGPVYVVYRAASLVRDKEAAFQGPSQLLSLIPGTCGSYLRTAFYVMTLRRCSPDCSISFGTIVSTPDCEIGSHVYVGAYCVVSDTIIGDDVLIGSGVHIVSGKHAHGFEAPDRPIRLQRASRRIIRVGANSWIGNGAIVMADVGAGSVIGAGSVVTREVPGDVVAAGNPARVLRSREGTAVSRGSA